MIDEILESSVDDLKTARAKIARVRESLAGLDDVQVRKIEARLERIEADLARMERAMAGQAVRAG